MQVGTKSRVFKVMKTPVPLNEQPEPLRSVLGYEFYEESPADHRVREYLLNPDPEERWKFYARVDDLAQDIAAAARGPGPRPSAGRGSGRRPGAPSTSPSRRRTSPSTATTSSASSSGAVTACCPTARCRLAVEDLTAAVNEDLARSELSIHLLGDRYGARPKNEDRSIPHVQLDLAGAARGSRRADAADLDARSARHDRRRRRRRSSPSCRPRTSAAASRSCALRSKRSRRYVLDLLRPRRPTTPPRRRSPSRRPTGVPGARSG